ncbi:MAG: hypothetical protein ABSF46_16335 [Terriglobia bacterium]
MIPDAVLAMLGKTFAMESGWGVECVRFFARTKIALYGRGLAGFGISFPQLIRNESKHFATLTGNTALDNAQTAVTNYAKQIAPPNMVNFSASGECLLIQMILAIYSATLH